MNLTQINDFTDYVIELFKNAPDYIVFITSSDTHVSKSGDQKLEILKSLGIKTDLQKTFRHSFLAVIENGKAKIELSSENKKIEATYEFSGHKAEIISQGFNAMPVNSSPVSVKIDGLEYALSKRGLNFVVWDKKSNKVTDSVVFDILALGKIKRNNPNDYEMLYKMYQLLWEMSIYSKDFIYLCRKKMSTYKMCLPPLYEYLYSNGLFLAQTAELVNRGITVLSFKHTRTEKLTNPTEWEKLCQSGARPSKDADKYFEISGMSKIYSRDVFDEILKHPVQNIKVKNYFRHMEQTSKYVNVDSFGQRPTESFPQSPYNTLYIFGNSIADTWELADQHTLTNQLQELVKDKYRVVNYSISGKNCYQAGHSMRDVNFEAGDVVVFVWSYLRHCAIEDDLKNIGVPIIDLFPYFDRPRDNEVFLDVQHLNPNGFKILAEAICEAVQNAGSTVTTQCSYTPTNMRRGNYLNSPQNSNSPYFAELSPWIDDISKHRPKIGSIVMNCNPFTLGHRYLIEQSSAKVDKLFIFVVEEDKSIFPFADRIELVRKGTADLPNVTVLPSGKFIISSLTFSDYFEKSELQDRVIDPSLDVQIFAEHIAPALGINFRFAGEEPLDNVTRQYNETMARILPEYGVSFEVIPRKELDGEVISASRVRRLLEAGDFGAISRIVPETTLSYLMSR